MPRALLDETHTLLGNPLVHGGLDRINDGAVVVEIGFTINGDHFRLRVFQRFIGVFVACQHFLDAGKTVVPPNIVRFGAAPGYRIALSWINGFSVRWSGRHSMSSGTIITWAGIP